MIAVSASSLETAQRFEELVRLSPALGVRACSPALILRKQRKPQLQTTLFDLRQWLVGLHHHHSQPCACFLSIIELQPRASQV